MDWNGDHLRPPFISRPETSFNFLYNNYDQHYPGTEMKLPMMTQAQYGVVPMMEKNNLANLDKKKRLTTEQLESLENSFQEEIKLDPDRKMKLAQELGLQPRQVAVWFQNRRARWKAKQLERLYDSLKMELDLVSREKHKLQEEVLALRAILLKDEGRKSKQVSAGYTDISGEGEDTVESTSVAAIQSSDYRTRGTNASQIQYQNQNINGDDQCNYVFNVEDYNPGVTGYWGCGANVMPSYP